MGENGTYVINRQPPNQQIWLSSPISGPKRYNFDLTRKKWIYEREPVSLDQLLSQELSLLLEQNVNLEEEPEK